MAQLACLQRERMPLDLHCRVALASSEEAAAAKLRCFAPWMLFRAGAVAAALGCLGDSH